MDSVQTTGRKAEALAYITDRIVRTGTSPSLRELSAALGVSTTRIKHFVRQLEGEGAVVRTPGAQRGLTVPGIAPDRERVLAELMDAGWRVVADDRTLIPPPPFPQGHLPLLPELDHIPEVVGGRMAR